jgi:hypothetical protein
LNHPEVEEAIRELEEELHRSTERLHAGLLRTSMRRMNKIIRQGEGKVALAAIELLWTSLGRLPQKGAPETNAFNQQVVQPLLTDPADMKAAMSLLKAERRRLEAEQPIALDPSRIE